MASITFKDASAEARTLNSKRDAQWITESIESGLERTLTKKEFDAAVQRGLAKAARKTRVP